MIRRLALTLILLSLSTFPACSLIDDAINKLSAKFDQIKAELKADAKQAMDRLEIAMQDAMKTFLEKGKQAADEKIKEVVTQLVALSPLVKGQVQDVIGGAMAKAISGDQGLLNQIKTMADQNPQALKSLADQFVGAIADSTQQQLGQGQLGQSLMAGISSSISSSIKDAVGTTANQVIGALKEGANSSSGSFTLNPPTNAPGNSDSGSSPNPQTGQSSAGQSSGNQVRVNTASAPGGNALDDDFFSRRVTMGERTPRPAGQGHYISPDNPEVIVLRKRRIR